MIRAVALCLALTIGVGCIPAANAQPDDQTSAEVAPPESADADVADDAPADGPSLSELEALMAEDTAPAASVKTKDAIDIGALAAFLLLALVSFWRKSTALKYTTMVAAVAYMGFTKGNLVSLVHIFGLIDLSLPILKYNIAWYMLMGFTLVSTVLWGRLYCGRICAFGAFTQLMDKILPAHWRYEPPRWFDAKAVYAKYVILGVVVIYYVITQDKFIYKYVEPFWMFTLTGNALMWSLLAALLLASVFIRNFYCRYLCSVGATLGLISSISVFRIKRWQLCNSCKLCQKKCEWGAISGPKISTSECVRCDDCEILYADKSKCPHWLLLAKNKLQRALSSART